jgi:ABC-type multidrug transport system fused ATPase/permease subunit
MARPDSPHVSRWKARELHLGSIAALAVVLMVSAILMVIFHNRFWAPADEGNYAHVADRLLSGQVLNRDVQDVHAGYINFANAAAFSIFGTRMVSLRYPLAVLTVVQSGLMFLLLRPRGLITAVIGALALTSLSFVQFLNPTANWYCLFLAIATIAWLSWTSPGHRARDIGTGVLVGTTFLFRQLSGVFLGLGVFVFLLLECSDVRADRRPHLARATLLLSSLGLMAYLLRVTEPVGWVLFGVWPIALLFHVWHRTTMPNRKLVGTLSAVSLGALLSTLPLLAYHLAHGSFRDWFGDVFGAAVSLPGLNFIKRPGYLMMGILAWRGFRSGDTAHLLNGALWVILLLLSTVVGLLLLNKPMRSTPGTPIYPLPVIASFYSLVSLHYQLPIYLFYTVGLSLAAILWLTADGPRATRKLTRSAAVFIASVALYYQAAMPLSRNLQGIAAGQRRFPQARLPSTVAGIYVDSTDAARYRRLMQLINRETEPGDTIFALPTNAELYFLSRRTNPFRFYNTALGIGSAADLASVLQLIRCRPPKLVFYDSKDKYNTSASTQIAALVQATYQSLPAIPPFQIFRRVSHTSPNVGDEHGCGSSTRPGG